MQDRGREPRTHFNQVQISHETRAQHTCCKQLDDCGQGQTEMVAEATAHVQITWSGQGEKVGNSTTVPCRHNPLALQRMQVQLDDTRAQLTARARERSG